MEYMSAREAASLWGISKRRVQKLCSEGRVEGAIKVGIVWAIPKGAKSPLMQDTSLLSRRQIMTADFEA